ncbi:unnamed protein product [Urochloa humidicola]
MAAAARRIQTTVLGTSTTAAQRIRTTVLGSSTAAGSRWLMSQDLLRHLPRKEGHTVLGLPQPIHLRLQQRPVCTSSSSDKDGSFGKTTAVAEELRKVQKGSSNEGPVDSGSLKKLEYRILKLEAACSFYKSFQWEFLGPIVGLLIAIPSAIYVVHGASILKERQKTAQELSDLKRQLEYLEGGSN